MTSFGTGGCAVWSVSYQKQVLDGQQAKNAPVIIIIILLLYVLESQTAPGTVLRCDRALQPHLTPCLWFPFPERTGCVGDDITAQVSLSPFNQSAVVVANQQLYSGGKDRHMQQTFSRDAFK